MKNPDKVKEGKYYKRAGMLFENKVRADLESKGWIVDRWSNQVELDNYTITKEGEDKHGKYDFCKAGKLVKAKSFMGRSRTNGFPDFIIFKRCGNGVYSVAGIEVKMKGKLSKEEKEKCVWYLENKVFSKIFIASQGEQRGEIKYLNFREKGNTQTGN